MYGLPNWARVANAAEEHNDQVAVRHMEWTVRQSEKGIESQVWGQEHVRNVREATLGLSPLDPADLGSNHEPPAVSSMLLTTRPLDRLAI